MESFKHLNWSFLPKKLTVYSRKQISQKVSPWISERVLNNANFYFDKILLPPTINDSPKSIDLMQNTSLLLTTTSSTLKLNYEE